MHKKNIKIKNRGETIIEVVVAIVISTMVLTATFLMLNRAISTNVNVKNRVIALNIAREGIEAVRNIRDTNWLKYSGDRRGKWLCHDTSDSLNECSSTGGDDELITGEYTVEYDTSYQRYYLKNASNNDPLDLSTGTDFSEYRLYYDSLNNRYTHDDSGGNSATFFYRQIQLTVHDGSDNTLPDDGGGTCTTSPQCQEAKLEIVSLVQWKEDGAVRGSKLEHHLYDFYERNSYDD